MNILINGNDLGRNSADILQDTIEFYKSIQQGCTMRILDNRGNLVMWSNMPYGVLHLEKGYSIEFSTADIEQLEECLTSILKLKNEEGGEGMNKCENDMLVFTNSRGERTYFNIDWALDIASKLCELQVVLNSLLNLLSQGDITTTFSFTKVLKQLKELLIDAKMMGKNSKIDITVK